LSISEFAIIEKYFSRNLKKRNDVFLGIGDDCALVKTPSSQLLAVTVDTMVEGVHFMPSLGAEDLAWKAIAINLSDLASMGAEPAWLTLSLTLPEVNEEWLETFSNSFYDCIDYYNLQLIGGDTCSGPLSITVQAMGFVPPQSNLKRSTAKPGDLICVTGFLGDAGLGLTLCKDSQKSSSSVNCAYLTERLHRPIPRIATGIALRHVATAAIDISDGLSSDLKHLTAASSVAATVDLDCLPLSEALLSECNLDEAISYAISAGDDYELCFTVAEKDLAKLDQAFKSTTCGYTKIGRITSGQDITYLRNGQPVDINASGYEHFKS
jgi:thiamine-monophosphate kinase